MRVLGIDYGARRIGLALSDATATLASPWRLVQRPPSEAETLRLMIKEITALAALPSRNELVAKLLGTMQAPVVKLVRTMNEVPSKLVRALAAVRDAKSGEAGQAA